METWLIVALVTLALTSPVLALSYYWMVLLVSSVKYPRNLGKAEVKLDYYPMVSILIATFNERFVIERSLEAIKHINYPKHKLQVVVADDSSDMTMEIIDNKIRDLNISGIKAIVSRRPTRENFKCGALNKAMQFVVGDYVLLLDSDSIVPSDVIVKGIDTLETHNRAAFVSYRYGHYNRNYNRVTRLFALSQDIGDTISKMGAYRIDAPFSSQGGFTMVRAKDLREVGQWSNERIADDTDVSIKMYLGGKRGIYLSNVTIMSEDPSTLEAWKKQVARTSQGWWRCIAKYWRRILEAKDVPAQKKLGLILMLLSPFSSLSWIIVTFLSASAILLNVVTPANSIFNNPIFLAIVTIPIAISMLSGAWALKVQGLLTKETASYIPMLGYATGCMLTLGSIGFFYGVFDRLGFFLYRTPKSGVEKEMTKTKYFRSLANDRNSIVEGVLAIGGIVLAIFVAWHGVWFLALSMTGFGLFTLKSMNLTRHLHQSETKVPAPELAPRISPRARD
jgi:cellulose synthase/poly-beta-1,6-N-acetylglucosamine synthase-like glycosyltransferase